MNPQLDPALAHLGIGAIRLEELFPLPKPKQEQREEEKEEEKGSE